MTLPSLPVKPVVEIENSALAPSAWLDEMRSFSGQLRPRQRLISFSGGFGMISSCVTDLAPWRNDVPMQSEPVSPPPMTMTCLSLAEISWASLALRLAGDAAVLLRQEIHGVVDAVEIAAGRLGEEVERMLGAAGQQQRVVRRPRAPSPRRPCRRGRCNGTSRPRLPSASRGAR